MGLQAPLFAGIRTVVDPIPGASRPVSSFTEPELFDEPHAPGIRDYDIGQTAGRCAGHMNLPTCLKALSHQIVETDLGATMLRSIFGQDGADGQLRIVGCHPDEGLVAMGADGIRLHIIQLTDAS